MMLTDILQEEKSLDLDNIHDNVVVFTNVRSLRANFNQVKEAIQSCKTLPIAFAMQEIWLPHETQLHIEKYHKLIKYERDMKNPNAGGGVGVFLRQDIEYKEIDLTFIPHDFETQALNLINTQYILINTYKAPRVKTETYIRHFSDLIRATRSNFPNKTIIIGGDFNIDLLKTNKDTELFYKFCEEEQLHPTIEMPTRPSINQDTLIDNILISKSNEHETGVLSLMISDHYATYISLPFKNRTSPIKSKQIKIDVEKLNNLIKSYNWSRVYNGLNSFIDVLTHMTEESKIEFTPNKKWNKLERWMTKGILVSRRTKLKLLKQLMTDRSKPDWKKAISEHKYRAYVKIYNQVIKAAKLKYAEATLRKTTNPKKIWDIINNYTNRKQSNNQSIAEIFDEETDTRIKDSTHMADAFNMHFSTIGPKLESKINKSKANDVETSTFSKTRQTSLKFQIKQVKPGDILKIIMKMKPKGSSGYDLLSNKILKNIANNILIPLTFFINEKIRTRKFPDPWKLAKVIPLFKGGDRTNLNQYRPISLLPAISKVYEKVIDKQLKQFLDERNILINTQFGFRKNHETSHAVMHLIREITTANTKNMVSTAVFIDVKKAFDCCNHQIILKKLDHYGIDKTIFSNYLQNREQFVTCNGLKSGNRKITCGVPQGSILGPTLFTIYINDLPRCTRLKTILFADDTTFIHSAKDIDTLTYETNIELKAIQNWFTQNALTVHPAKSNYLIFNNKRISTKPRLILNDTEINQCGELLKQKSITYVGIEIDDQLSWKYHKQKVLNKLRSNHYLISSNKQQLPTKMLITLYNAIIRPHIEYGLILWGHTNTKKIEIMQRNIIRSVNNLHRAAHTNFYFLNNKILKFKDLLSLNCLKLVTKFKNDKLPAGISGLFEEKEITKQTRQSGAFMLKNKIPNKNKDMNFTHHTVKIWNESDLSLREHLTNDTLKETFLHLKFLEYSKKLCNERECYSCSRTPSHD